MSEENVESMRRAIEAFNARDIDALLSCFDPRAELHSTFAAVGGGVYRGHDGLRKWHGDLHETWGGELRQESEAFFDLGDRTVSFDVIHGRGQQSGVEVAMPIAIVYTWRDGLAVLLKAYADRETALRDLGISLAELEPIAP